MRKARNFAFSKYNEIYPPQANNKHNVFRLRFKELQRQHDALPSAYQGTTGLVERINIAGMKVIGTPNMLDLDDVNKALKKIKEIKHIAHETEYLERWRAKTEKRG